MTLEGRVALVTGAASGIGRAVAERLSAEGAHVVLADLDLAGAEAAAAALPSAQAQGLDVTDADAVDALVEEVAARRGGLDVMVANAGVIDVRPVAETSAADWRRVLGVNLDGAFHCAAAAARVMSTAAEAGRPAGSIVLMSSGAGRAGVPRLAAYCASKAGVISLAQTLAQELGSLGIRVNAVAPGHIETPFWEDIAAGFAARTGAAPEAVVEGFRAGVPMGRFGRPDEVAAAVAWLCGPDAAYVSGQTIAMNGAELPGG